VKELQFLGMDRVPFDHLSVEKSKQYRLSHKVAQEQNLQEFQDAVVSIKKK
jgi:hypothetical protein